MSKLSQLPANTLQSTLRLQLAAIRLSGGSLLRLDDAIKLANDDFRDLLMGSGFGEDTNAHANWIPRPFKNEHLEQWRRGVAIAGVQFSPNEDVWFRRKPARIRSLESFEPDVTYCVRRETGKELLVAQNQLQKRGITKN